MTIHQFEPYRKRREEQVQEAANKNVKQNSNTIKYIGLAIGIAVLVLGSMYAPGKL